MFVPPLGPLPQSRDESKLTFLWYGFLPDWTKLTPRQKATFVEAELKKMREGRDVDAAHKLTYILQGQLELTSHPPRSPKLTNPCSLCRNLRRNHLSRAPTSSHHRELADRAESWRSCHLDRLSQGRFQATRC